MIKKWLAWVILIATIAVFSIATKGLMLAIILIGLIIGWSIITVVEP